VERAGALGSWGELYVMLGTSSAALLGLLFVATSLHLVDLEKSSGYRTRALYNNYFLLLTLFEATCVLVPQPLIALGAELTAANLFLFLLTFRAVYRFVYRRPELGQQGGYSVSRSVAFLCAFAAGAIGGGFLFFHFLAGLYIVTAAYVLVLITVAQNAWAIMAGLGRVESVTPRRSRKRRNPV
jgi:hypothetical protein